MRNKLLKGFWGRVWTGTFLPIWFSGLFGMVAISPKDRNILFGLLFGVASIGVAIGIITGFDNLKNNKEGEEKGSFGGSYGLALRILFGIFWVTMMSKMVLPDMLASYSSEEILSSTGLKIFGGALLVGFLYALFMDKFVDSKKQENLDGFQELEVEKSYSEERKGKGFFESLFSSKKNDRFRR